MKKLKIFFAIISIASNYYAYCQQETVIFIPDDKVYKPLIPTGEIKTILDSIFPGATYEFGATKDIMQRNGCIVNIIKDDRKDGIGPSDFLNTQIRFIDKSNTSDTGFIYSPVSVVKAFVYFDVIYGQDKYFDNDLAPSRMHNINNDFNPVVVNETNLTVSRIFEDLSDDWSYKYSAMDSSERFLNYRAVVKLNPNRYYQFFGSKWLQADEIVYNFQISDGIIMGYQFYLNYNSVKVFDSKYRSLADHGNKILKGHFDIQFNQKKKSNSKSNTTFWTNVRFSNPIDLIYYNEFVNNKYYIRYITIESNGQFTSGNTKFSVEGCDNSYQNLELRIYSLPIKNEPRVLLYSSLLENSNNTTRVTQSTFQPQDNNFDGFCTFEIWSNNANVFSFQTSCYLVLERRKHEDIFGYSLDLIYAKSFFNSHPNGISYCDSYLNKTFQYYKNAWQKQINEYHLLQDKPMTTNNLYELAFQPAFFQNKNNYYSYHNNIGLTDCYFSNYSNHHLISTTINPSWFIDHFDGYENTRYSEDEFLNIEMSHEFYHGVQNSLCHSLFPQDNSKKAYNWLIEGQARAIQTLDGNPLIEFKGDNYGFYALDANNYLISGNNSSFTDLSYNFCLFWRYLFENCYPNGTNEQKLSVFKNALNEVCDAPSTIEGFKGAMDVALQTTPYNNFNNALNKFAIASTLNDPIYGLWNPDPGNSFYSDDVFYKTITYAGSTISFRLGEMHSFSFKSAKINFNTKGKVQIGFNGAIDNTNCDFLVSLVLQSNTNNIINIPVTQGVGSLELELDHDNETGYIIITRTDVLDYQELGHCAIIVGPIVPNGVQKADFGKTPNKASGGNVLVDSPVSFVDKSIAGTYPITHWNWSFPGASPASSTAQHPSGITYEYPGVYPVSLTITNEIGETDTKTVNDFITVYDPGEGTGGDEIEIVGMNQGFSLENMPVSFNLQINSGLPPFNVSISYGDGSVFSKQNVYDLYYYETHSYASGQYEITYSVTDALGNTGVYRTDISIGFPGSHDIDFDLTWGTGFPDYLGENTWVTITDKTTGGYKPYTLWNWDYGKGINTGIWPITDADNTWETRWNINNDKDFDGSPINKVKFLAYDQYPINVQVVDADGYMKWKTKIINVTPLPKCLLCDSRDIHPYDDKYKKHILKYNASNKYIWAIDNFNNYFPWYTNEYIEIAPSSYCRAHYPHEGDFWASKNNAITNVKYKVERNGINYGNGSFEMSDDYMNHPPPSNWEGQNASVYYCWWEMYDNHFYDGWFWRNWPAPSSPEDCAPYYFSDPPANCVRPYRTLDLVLPETGKYNFTFEIWNRNAHTLSECMPENSPNAPMYNYLTIPIYVVDCQADEYINTTISGTHDDEIAGNFVFANTSAAIIETNAEIIYQSCNGAIFNPGFTAKLGCDFLAQVSGFEDTDNSIDRLIKQDDNILLSKPLQKAESIECYPNPSDGEFAIVLNSSDNISDVQVFSLTGQLINTDFTLNHNIADVHIVKPASSFYMLKVITSNDKVYIKKIIVQSLLKK